MHTLWIDINGATASCRVTNQQETLGKRVLLCGTRPLVLLVIRDSEIWVFLW